MLNLNYFRSLKFLFFGVFLFVSLIVGLVSLTYAYEFKPEKDLLAHWRFDKSQTWPTSDSSSNNYEGYAHNVLTSLSGIKNHAFLFQGDSYITMGDLSVFDIQKEEELTVSAWVKMDEDISDYRAILGKADSSSRNGYILRHETEGNFGFRIEDPDSSEEVGVIAEEDYRDEKWHHVLAVIDKDKQELGLYVDGYLKDNTGLEEIGSVANSNHFNIGALDNGSVGFEGIIDEVRLYNYALNHNQIIQLYNHECDCKGIDLSSIYPYPAGSLLRAEGDRNVYYINGKHQKKLIINKEVFNLYNNNWNDVEVVAPEVLNAYRQVNLIRAENGYKVYLIEGKNKTWISSIEEFNERGYSWDEVDVVKLGELKEYDG